MFTIYLILKHGLDGLCLLFPNENLVFNG